VCFSPSGASDFATSNSIDAGRRWSWERPWVGERRSSGEVVRGWDCDGRGVCMIRLCNPFPEGGRMTRSTRDQEFKLEMGSVGSAKTRHKGRSLTEG
jgi:hypothetical protein